TAALDSFAAGQSSEHAALAALAASRLLVPVVAMLTGQERDGGGPAGGGPAGGGLRGEKASEIALPTLVGHDGRRALLAFTCLDSLIRWRPDARPVPVPAADVWRAGAEEASAVVIDVAGPVPIAVDGARLTALATDEAVPPPHQDHDVITLVADMVAREPVLTGFRLLPGEPGTDMTLHVRLAPGHAATEALPQEAIARVAAGVMGGAGARLRRGVAVAASEAAPLADEGAGGP
ncbi:MAG TPA: SseB family protein, partial [Streptosporangiaceae bacterium]